ncbi:MAG: Flp pilus assembly protein CpaB [Acidimicrobiales bacterium]
MLIILGVAFFVLGAALVFLLVGEDDDSASSASGRDLGSTQILVASGDITAGTTGDAALSDGLVELTDVDAIDIAPGALSSTHVLAGQTFSADVATGSQVTSAALRPAQARGASFEIPEGKQAVAVQLDFVPGVAGYVGVGDIVNVYALGQSPDGSEVNLVVSNVAVLDVSLEVAPRRAAADQATERVTGNAITYLLALDPNEAARLIHDTSFNNLYLALAKEGAPRIEGEVRADAGALR